MKNGRSLFRPVSRAGLLHALLRFLSSYCDLYCLEDNIAGIANTTLSLTQAVCSGPVRRSSSFSLGWHRASARTGTRSRWKPSRRVKTSRRADVVVVSGYWWSFSHLTLVFVIFFRPRVFVLQVRVSPRAGGGLGRSRVISGVRLRSLQPRVRALDASLRAALPARAHDDSPMTVYLQATVISA